MTIIIFSESINHLALTAIVEAGKIRHAAVEPYSFYKKSGINFYFELRDTEMFAIMESKHPSNSYKEEANVNDHIKALVIEYKMHSFKLS